MAPILVDAIEAATELLRHAAPQPGQRGGGAGRDLEEVPQRIAQTLGHCAEGRVCSLAVNM